MLCRCGYRPAGSRLARQPPAARDWARWSKGSPRPGRSEPYIMADCEPARNRRASARAVGVGGEALTAAALGGRVGVGEGELLVQPLAGEIDPGTGHQRRALPVDVHPHAVLLNHEVAVALVAGQVHHVTPARAAGLLDAEAHAQGVGVAGEESLDA